MTHNCTIDLTGNNKSKPSGSQIQHENSQATANNNNNQTLKGSETTPHKDSSKNSKFINGPSKKLL